MKKQLEDIRFFADSLGISYFPVADFTGKLIDNALALVGLYRQTELELCAQFLHGKIMSFDRTADNKMLVLKTNGRNLKNAHHAYENLHLQGVSATGVLVQLES